MRRSFKYRLFTNANQERELAIALETHRRLYNECLEYRKMAWEQYRASVSFVDQCRWLTLQRKSNLYLSKVNAHSAQATMRKLENAFSAFFRRVKNNENPGYPRFKSRDHFESFRFTKHGDGARITGNRLYVQHIGTIRVKLHRPVDGTIKTVTLKREADKWYVVFSCVLPDVPVMPTNRPAVGVDVGLTSFLATSDGMIEPNPRYLKTALPELHQANRSVSRKKRGGNNRRKAVRKLRKIHVRVKNLRKEHHHQVACRLIRRYGLVAVESLNIRNMVKNDRLSRAISDVGWYGFMLILKCKAESAGIPFVEVDPKGTSQECSGCGAIVQKDLSQRWHSCECGCSLDRDENAARNILARALLARTEPAGLNVADYRKRAPISQRRKSMA